MGKSRLVGIFGVGLGDCELLERLAGRCNFGDDDGYVKLVVERMVWMVVLNY